MTSGPVIWRLQIGLACFVWPKEENKTNPLCSVNSEVEQKHGPSYLTVLKKFLIFLDEFIIKIVNFI